METTIIATSDLAKAVGMVAPVANNASALPIVKSVHLVPGEDTLTVSATDLQMWVTARISARPASLMPGEKSLDAGDGTCISAKNLSTLVATLAATDTQITFPNGNNKAAILSGRVKADLLCLPGEEFPSVVMDGEQSGQVALPVDMFCASLERAGTFVSNDSARPILASIYIEGKDRGLTFVATDTHSLYLRELTTRQQLNPLGILMIAGEHAKHLVRLLRATKAETVTVESVSPSTGARFIRASVESAGIRLEVVVRTMEGAFPHYQRVIPTAHTIEWTLDKADLLKSLSRVSIAAADNANRVVASSDVTELTISAESGTTGTISDGLEISSKGDQLDICFNGKFARRCLECVEGDGVTFRLTEALRPMVVVPTDEPNPEGWNSSTLMVLMPMQVV